MKEVREEISQEGNKEGKNGGGGGGVERRNKGKKERQGRKD